MSKTTELILLFLFLLLIILQASKELRGDISVKEEVSAGMSEQEVLYW